jgi:hypothetical protein
MAITPKTRRVYKGAATPTTITTAISNSADAFSITAAAGWPTVGPFYAVIDPGVSSEEKVYVGAISGTSLSSVVRGVDDTTVVAHASGAAIYPVFTAVDADEANQLTATYTTKGGLVYMGDPSFTQLAIGSTTGHLLRVSSGGVPEWGQVATAGLADNSVTSAKIVDGTIVAGDLASNSVTTVKIADANVTTAKIADLNVTTGKIADLNVTTGKIADSAITSAKIADGTIVAADIASNAVTTIKILDANVTTAKIADSNVTTAKIADSAITSVKIADGTIVAADLASNSVTTVKITDANVTTAKIADANVTNAKLNNGASGDIPLVTVSSSAATGGKNGDIWIVV